MKNTLKVQRAIHDMTQDDLAKKVGVTRQTINSIETQKYDPSLSLAFKLAKLFKVGIEELFIYEEELIKSVSGEVMPAYHRKAEINKVNRE